MRQLSCLISFLGLSLIAPGQAEEIQHTPKEILEKVDNLFRENSSHGTSTMSITTRHWKRTLRMEYWSKGKEKSLIRILSPKKEKGTATLRSGNNLWNYLPKVKRVIKLPSSMMSASWMGSHLTNDDLVKETRMADDFTYEVTFHGERGGQKVVEVTCIPKEDAVVVWGKVAVLARVADYLPVELKYFDEDFKLARTLIFSDIREFGGKTIPATMSMTPADKPHESTVMTYEQITFGEDYEDGFFSLRNLQK
tara:strand:- start:308 stop:1063 length:756 start_codon:yes stop_codon:yes gene_type:complete